MISKSHSRTATINTSGRSDQTREQGPSVEHETGVAPPHSPTLTDPHWIIVCDTIARAHDLPIAAIGPNFPRSR